LVIVKTCNYNNICAFVSFQIKRKLGVRGDSSSEEGSEEEVVIGEDATADDNYDGMPPMTVVPDDQETASASASGATPSTSGATGKPAKVKKSKSTASKGMETCLEIVGQVEKVEKVGKLLGKLRKLVNCWAMHLWFLAITFGILVVTSHIFVKR
jgi:hypothetical protein